MNIKLLTTLTIATLLFTACGSDSKSSPESAESQIKKKDFIYILQHKINCDISKVKENSIEFSNLLEIPRTINPNTMIGTTVNSSVRCETYGRTHDSRTCEHWDFEEATEKSCVIGFDFKN